MLGFNGADAVDHDGHSLARDWHDAHVDRPAAAAFAGTLLSLGFGHALGRLLAGLLLPPVISATRAQDAEDQKHFQGRLHEYVSMVKSGSGRIRLINQGCY
jgi:hypothetical protein